MLTCGVAYPRGRLSSTDMRSGHMYKLVPIATADLLWSATRIWYASCLCRGESLLLVGRVCRLSRLLPAFGFLWICTQPCNLHNTDSQSQHQTSQNALRKMELEASVPAEATRGFLSLPNESLIDIADPAHPSSLPALRLTCRVLFRTIFEGFVKHNFSCALAYFPDDSRVRRLKHMLTHPYFKNRVQHIIVTASLRERQEHDGLPLVLPQDICRAHPTSSQRTRTNELEPSQMMAIKIIL